MDETGDYITLKKYCRKAVDYAKGNDYSGYSKYDALNSPLLRKISINNKYLRLIYTQAVMRAPFNVRPILFIPKEKNPKSLGLFAHTYCNLYELWRDSVDREQALYCLNWLLDNKSPGNYAGSCWGYNFGWQTPSFYAPRYTPNMVVSTVVGQALIRAFEVFGDQHYIDVARSIVEFIRHNLNVIWDEKGSHYYSYTPVDYSKVINISALGAGFMSQLYKHTGETDLLEEARELIHFVVGKQTDYNAWYYTDPPGHSPLTHDNYHTGFILDSILDYINISGDQHWILNYLKGLDFYARELFLEDGTPKFLFNRVYPIDIHGAAQGIISFSRAAQIDPKYQLKAIHIALWTINNMMAPDGHFYYQRFSYFTKRFSLMRWAQGWMSLALSIVLKSLEGK